MKVTKLLGLTTLLLGIAAADAQQQIIPVTISARIISQSTNTTDVRGVTTTPPPRTRNLSNRDILKRLSDESGTTFPRGSRLAVVDGSFAVVQGTNIVQDVSSIIRLEFGTTTIRSGRQNDTNGLASPTITKSSLGTLIFDDTGINSTNGLRFAIQGIVTTFTTDSRPNNATGVYTQVDTATMTNATGDGTNNVGSGDEQPILVTGSVTAAGSNRLALPL